MFDEDYHYSTWESYGVTGAYNRVFMCQVRKYIETFKN